MLDKKALQEKISRKSYQYKAAFDELMRAKTRLIIEIDTIQANLDKKDEVSNALNILQIRTQEKTKNIYETLLTKLIHEIKGHDKENHKLILKTRIKSNKPWLDIEIESESGHSRDVYLDKGGSIENIVSMGLRFITLSRTSNRRFLAFDEADKNLSSKYMPKIAKMLFELSKQIGIQVLYISHADKSNFEGFAKIINISRSNGSIITECLSDIDESTLFNDDEINDELDGVGIRYLRLQNFKQHENTLIELGKFVTVITGDVDIGKSTIIQAIDAVNKNLGRDGLIRDDQQQCRVEIGLESESTLTWSYKLRGNKKTKYILTDKNNVEIQRSDNGNTPPEWLSEYLGMPSFKDFDINISDRQNASFILDSKISGHKRAEIMSLGQESNQVMSMIKLHAQEVERNVKSLNQYKKELSETKNRLSCYRHIFKIEEAVNSFNEITMLIQNNERAISDFRASIIKIEKSKQRLSILEKTANLVKLTPPLLKSNPKNMDLIRAIEKSKSLIEIYGKSENSICTIPKSSTDQGKLNELGKNIAKTRAILEIYSKSKGSKIENIGNVNIDNSLKIITNLQKTTDLYNLYKTIPLTPIRVPQRADLGISQSGTKISMVSKEILNISEMVTVARKDLVEVNDSISKLSDQLKNNCPLCGSKINLNGICHEKV
jgi:hypothetical protein